ncbi:MAG TPA: hypothetical protein VKY22_28065 [Bradyrhizobium sp.]|nr:hypothetical protein [Bradyrhizobium sp.]
MLSPKDALLAPRKTIFATRAIVAFCQLTARSRLIQINAAARGFRRCGK